LYAHFGDLSYAREIGSNHPAQPCATAVSDICQLGMRGQCVRIRNSADIHGVVPTSARSRDLTVYRKQ